MRYILITATSILLILVLSACRSEFTSGPDAVIQTVTGTIDAGELGFAFTHEHIMSNFGLDPGDASDYDETALYNRMIPYLRYLKSMGINSIFDCTTDYFGRRADILKTVSDSTGIHIVTNTGFYGAANDRYVPDFVYDKTAENISRLWIDEFESGIGGTGIRPGFIKLAFDDGIPSETDIKLFKAGILAHLETGLTIVVHTGNNNAAAATQLELLENYKVSPEAWVWVHANHAENTDRLIKAASEGAWISLDGVSNANIEEYLDKINLFKAHNLLDRVLLSHDGDGFPMGEEMRKFEAIPMYLIPAMRTSGFSEDEINQLMVQNPKEAFSIRIRRRD